MKLIFGFIAIAFSSSIFAAEQTFSYEGMCVSRAKLIVEQVARSSVSEETNGALMTLLQNTEIVDR